MPLNRVKTSIGSDVIDVQYWCLSCSDPNYDIDWAGLEEWFE